MYSITDTPASRHTVGTGVLDGPKVTLPRQITPTEQSRAARQTERTPKGLFEKSPLWNPPKTFGNGLFDFLFQVIEDGRVEKILDGDLQTVADFFDGVDLGILIFLQHNVT